ncbi:hypothetical protein DFQ28_006964 [Apophysomyces sp. BC1034]|nr:hypothetical protein DFQ30_006889 [Apophysomyces sp. BC1015]KAG0176945.1 hypothetical protein DFQ29_005442 [Apophysomyces sp. BC1021]KAG0187026.1 hypothetical protein DFQ28_006964 [Apophysomyces sp. BC1034]
MATGDLDVSNYELERQQKIEENQRLLRELGLTPGQSILKNVPPMPVGLTSSRKRAKYSYKKAAPSKQVGPTRISRRIKGEEPEKIADLEEILDQDDRARQIAINLVEERRNMSLTNKEELPKNIYVPLTLTSIGTTILSLGEIYTGKGRTKYWSSRGCRYKHPYPIGYRATKSHFGNNYTMSIEKGLPGEGPVFTVQVNSSGAVFKGMTPTAPWTDACKRSNSQGTRVSGPLFYGFSDLVTMQLIEGMEGYELASKPETADEAGA